MNLSLEWMEGWMDGWMDAASGKKNRTLVVERALTRHRCDLTLSVKTTGAAAVGLRHSVDRVLSRKHAFFGSMIKSTERMLVPAVECNDTCGAHS